MSQPSSSGLRRFSLSEVPTQAWGALVFGLTLLAYAATLRAGLVWNDADYITRPELRTWHGLWRIWFEVGSTEQHYPLLHSAFWFEHLLWGDAPAGYHLANILFHAGSACLFARILQRLAVRGAWLAALIFALHPVGVESVAWISEQKNTLSTLLFLAAALAYLRYDAAREDSPTPAATTPAGPASAPRRKTAIRHYRLATLFFLAALLAKSLTATLPAALLVIVWWRRGRIGWRRDVLPLLPWFVVGAAMGLFSAWVERNVIGANGAEFNLTFAQRLLVAGRAPWVYLYHTLWPANLIFIYPHWEVDPPALWQWLYPLALVVTGGALWWYRRRHCAPLTVYLLFVGLLFPVIGFFNLYAYRYSYVADHWQYLATLPVIACAGALVARLPARLARFPAWVPSLGAGAFLALLGGLSFRQSLAYHDLATFYRAIIARNPGCWMAHNNLGSYYLTVGDNTAAATQFSAALDLRPKNAESHSNLGSALLAQNLFQQALEQYRLALELNPALADAQNNYATAAYRLGRTSDALDHYRRAIALNPDYADARGNLGYLLVQLGQPQAGLKHLLRARRVDPGSPDIQDNLGSAYFALGRVDDAIVSYETALRLRPGFDIARINLGNALLRIGRTADAIAQYETVLHDNPANVGARVNLGNALGQAGRLRDAVAQYEIALRQYPNFAEAHNNLGFALLRLERYEEAAEQFREALAIRPDYPEAKNNLSLANQALARKPNR